MATSTSPMLTTFTTIQLIAIVLLAAGVIAAMVWGIRAKRRRKAEIAEIATVEEGGGALSEADRTPPATAGAPPPPPAMTIPAPPPGEDDAPARVAEPDAPAAVSASGDDLTRLKGLGPKVAARLGELGVTRFAELAALSPAAAEALDEQLGPFAGRMARDRWVEQARYLAAGDRAGFEAEFGRL